MCKFYKVMMIDCFLGSGNSMRKVIEMGKFRGDITHPEIPLTWKRGRGPEWHDRHRCWLSKAALSSDTEAGHLKVLYASPNSCYLSTGSQAAVPCTGAHEANFHVLRGPLSVPPIFLPSRIIGLIISLRKWKAFWSLTPSLLPNINMVQYTSWNIEKVQCVAFLFLFLLLWFNQQMANLPLL